MPRIIVLLLACVLPLYAPAYARDDVYRRNFHSVVKAALQDGQLDGSVKFYLKGETVRGKIQKTFPEAVSNKKTNASNKTDEDACDWALRSVLISFQENAKKQGANAVIDLVSFYKKQAWQSASQFECHAGAWMAGVAMKGRAAVVK
ncbi:MAG: excinuclease ATPase subunit [Zoogloeaceae bacterium]|jgi:uncharacterized protein YbjQ (UPF0145 family)|nr:excinuclease ATPase subunit [Zoogloeaceae bacterium]